MSEETDFYKILGVDKNVDDAALKKAWRRFSMKHHPDMQHGKSDEEKKAEEDLFKKGQAAYECLSDPEKRRIYDEYGIDGLQGHAQQGGFSSGMSDGLADFIRKHMNGFSFGGFDPFGGDDGGWDFNPFGKSARNSKPKAPSNLDPEDGQSYRIKMAVDLEDVIFGTEKEFTMDGYDVCPECHGKKCESYEECPECHGNGMTQRIQGNMIFQSTCQRCHGSGFSAKNLCKKCNGEGRIKVKRQIKVKIPKGMPEGGQLRVRGGGVCGLNGGKTGDLFIIVTTKEHPIFVREDDLNLKIFVYVNPLISVFGGNVAIPTPYEMRTKYLSAGTKNGQNIVLKGCGIRTEQAEGDLLVVVLYDEVSSRDFTDEEKDILKKAFETINSNKSSLTNSNRQSNVLNHSTKLPWIIEV